MFHGKSEEIHGNCWFICGQFMDNYGNFMFIQWFYHRPNLHFEFDVENLSFLEESNLPIRLIMLI